MKIDFESVRALYCELLEFLTRHETDAIRGCIPLICETIDMLASQDSEEDKTQSVLRSYAALFRTRGGLSEFYLWDDDFQKRLALNEPFEKIRDKLWRTMKPFFT